MSQLSHSTPRGRRNGARDRDCGKTSVPRKGEVALIKWRSAMAPAPSLQNQYSQGAQPVASALN